MGRLRLNITTLLGDEVNGRFLVVMEPHAGLEHLHQKIQNTLRTNGSRFTVEKVLNSSKSMLPHDEQLGDMLRDGEELIVVLRGGYGDLLNARRLYEHHSYIGAPAAAVPPLPPPYPAQQAAPGANHPSTTLDLSASEPPSTIRSPRGGGIPVPITALFPLPPRAPPEPAQEDAERPYPPEPATPKGPLTESTQRVAFADHPGEAIAPRTHDNDWLLEHMTPKLRDFLWEHRGECTQDPQHKKAIGKLAGPRYHQRSGHHVSVFVGPHGITGSEPSSSTPMRYNVAKTDIHAFQKKAHQQVLRAQEHLDMYSQIKRALKARLAKGKSEDDDLDVMLPVSYELLVQSEGIMAEVEKPYLPKITGQRPIIVVDPSGPAVAENMKFIKASLKRALYAHVAGSKDKFQLISFGTSGEVKLWGRGMQVPTEDALRSAEAWIDGMKLATGKCKLLNAVRSAVAHDDADCIYILSSGEAECGAGSHAILSGIRSLNVRNLEIHTVGIQPRCEAELLLRSIAEKNHGDFVHKSFREPAGKSSGSTADPRWTSWRTAMVTERIAKLAESFKKQKLTIGGQIKIIEAMEEEERQVEQLWSEEWRCVQRLLPKDETDSGMDQLFERRPVQAWAEKAITAAAGPGVPKASDASPADCRAPKLPPRQHLPEPEWKARPQSARRRPASATRTPAPPQAPGPVPGKPPANPWHTASNSSLDRSRRAKADPNRAVVAGVVDASPHRNSICFVRQNARGSEAGLQPAADGRGRSSSSTRNRVPSADKAAGMGKPSAPAPKPARVSKSPAKKLSASSPKPPALAAATAPAQAAKDLAAPAPLPFVASEASLDRRWSF